MPRLLYTIVLITLSACTQRSRPEDPRPQNNVVTRDEIAAAAGVNTAYEALNRLRPRFLRPHATGGRPQTTNATVFIDGVRRGDLEVLHTIAASSIMEIRYLASADAALRYGLDVPGGVIDVKLRR